MDLEVEAVMDDMKGVSRTPLEMFAALVRHLAGPAEIYGEKTPAHLWWWRPLTNAWPHLKLVVVVRDPRAVVASTLSAPWQPKPAFLLAHRWAADQAVVKRAARALGPSRCLILRYEQVVRDPVVARSTLARFLGAPEDSASPLAASPVIALPWESWKENVYGEITPERINAWRDTLTSRQALTIEAICRRSMEAFGYETPDRSSNLFSRPLDERLTGLRYRTALRRQLGRIERTRL